MMKLIQRVNVDFTAPMLEELERHARELNISRQAVIKTLIRQGLDQRHWPGLAPKSEALLTFLALSVPLRAPASLLSV